MSSDNINQFYESLRGMTAGRKKVQTAWAVVKSVDWEAKRMVATGVLDNLDYVGVLLGVGNKFTKPTVGSKCLIGMIENKDASMFLIDAEEVDLFEYNQGGLMIEVDSVTNKVSIKNAQVSMLDLFQDLKDLIMSLKVATPSGPSTNLLPDSILELEAFELSFKQLLY